MPFLYHLAHFHQELQYNSDAACSSIQMKAAKNHSACTMIFYKTTIHLYQELLCVQNLTIFSSLKATLAQLFYTFMFEVFL
jgi:hypothetical protein